MAFPFYAYEKIKDDRANLRRQGRAEGVAETLDAMRAKFKEDPDLSPEGLLEVLMADLQNNGRSNCDRGVQDS